jgi:lipopolysaccharide biosynthesis glycosyltransferase
MSAPEANEFALVFAGDERYARGIAVAMHSTLSHLSAAFRPEIYVLGNDLSESSRVRLLKVVKAVSRSDELRWMQIPSERFGHLATINHLTPAAYTRLLIPEIVSRHIRRAVYLDADVMVRRDLSPLFTIELGDALVGGVRDFAITSTDHDWSGVRDRAHPTPYFNTGVLVMDLARWRSMGLAERALQYAAADGEPLPWADQDALNAVVESWHELDYQWNVQLNLFLAERPPPTNFTDRLYDQRWCIYRAGAILHFTGPPKPWSPWRTTPGTMSWVRTLMRTGWYSRREGLIWLIRWLGNRARSWLGATRRRWRAALIHRSSPASTPE